MVAVELLKAKEQAISAGVMEENILFDPGFGFAKTPDQCWELLENLEKVAPLSRMLVGVSRKSFLGALTGEKDPSRRNGETIAVELILAKRGVAMLRTHNSRELHHALMVMHKTGEIC